MSILAKDSDSINKVDLVQYSGNDLPFSSVSNYEGVVYEPTTDYVVFSYQDNTNEQLHHIKWVNKKYYVKIFLIQKLRWEMFSETYATLLKVQIK